LKSNIGKTARFKDKVTIAQEETIPNIWNGTMFGDLDWPLNASRGFVTSAELLVELSCGQSSQQRQRHNRLGGGD